jgi:plastocyanin
VAGYVMGVAAMVQNRPRITSRALGVALALGLVGVVVAGGLSAAAGTRSFEEESEGGEGEAAAESAEGGGSGEGSGEGGSGGIPSGAKVFTAQELEFTATPDSLSAGEATIALDNQAGVVHNVAFEGVDGGEPIVEAEGSETATGEVEVESGELTYFCSVPGHREAGMEGTLTVE